MASRIGITFPRTSYEVEKGKIREFVQAIGDENPIYIDEEVAKQHGLKTIPIPKTFEMVIEMRGAVLILINL